MKGGVLLALTFPTESSWWFKKNKTNRFVKAGLKLTCAMFLFEAYEDRKNCASSWI